MRLALIVPYRDRRDELDVFLPHMVEFLSNKQIDYKIFIAEQSDDRPFNYGKLCNAIVNEIKEDFDYFCFHDIDLLPKNDDSEYYYVDQPTQIFGFREDEGSDLPYEEFFGGVTLFPKELFEKVNGFSNDYWGKGYVDMDMLFRCTQNNIKLQKRYAYSTNEIFKSDLKRRKIKRVGSVLRLSPKSIFMCQNSNHLDSDFTVSFFYREMFTPLNKNTMFKTNNGWDFQIFSNDNQIIVQLFNTIGTMFQVEIKDIDLAELNNYVITHNKSKKLISIYCNSKLIDNITYSGSINMSNKTILIGDVDNMNEFAIHDFKLFSKCLDEYDVRKEYYYGIDPDWLDLRKPCLFQQNSLFLDMTGSMWQIGGVIDLDCLIDIKTPPATYLPNRKNGQFDITGLKFENLLDTYDPDIIENKLTYLDLVDGKIDTKKFGLNSIKYTKLNNVEFDKYTEWYKIVT
jgi:hypothetical protein